ncbi:EAL domain-containing protein [uncultured Jatrophihabitans sp.]|uniref:EAL domain-containing protein n=1 Tax=uncultured Jatrophihabitans sp. TaxID=1610747 RepID=UPI0035CB50C1
MKIDDVIAQHAVRTVLQPIVDLDTGAVVAYEALTRGPAGELEQPDRLFAAARTAGRLAELDALCRTASLDHAVETGIAAPLAIFVNVEPEVLDDAALDGLIEIAQTAPGGLPVVLEITERAISARPAELLSCVRKLRQAGWLIALDDVGADDMSLAFMPLLRPDVVKLDLKLVQERPGPAIARIVNAVNAYAQEAHAIVLAEGIEDDEHLAAARALGASLGQGYLFGRPESQPRPELRVAGLELGAPAQSETPRSPFSCLSGALSVRTSTKPLLIEFSKHLEREAATQGSTCVVISTFQHQHHFTPTTAGRYRELVEHVGFVAALGDGLTSEPVPGVRGADLADDDPLRHEWDIVVLSPHFAAALLARDLGDTGPDDERRFEFALTYDRQTVRSAAESLMSRVAPLPQEHFRRRDDRQPGRVARRQNVLATQVNSPESVRTLHRALTASPNGISIADMTRSDHPLIYVNAAFERLSGLRADEVLGVNCRLLQGEHTDPAAVARIGNAIRRGVESRETVLNYRRGSREPWWNEIRLTPIFDDGGRLVQYLGIQTDVTAHVLAQAELEKEKARAAEYLAEMETLAFYDPLTGLLNRRRLSDRLTRRLDGRGDDPSVVGLLYLDVDDFKRVNDSQGHAAGDAVLAAIAERLRAEVRPQDVVARLGGDEFLVVLDGLVPTSAQAQLRWAATRLKWRLHQDLALSGVTVSIGTSSCPHDGADLDSLLHAADVRMYRDKARGRAVGPRALAASISDEELENTALLDQADVV